MNLYILGINIGSYWSMLVIATIVCVYLSIKRAPAFKIKFHKRLIEKIQEFFLSAIISNISDIFKIHERLCCT